MTNDLAESTTLALLIAAHDVALQAVPGVRASEHAQSVSLGNSLSDAAADAAEEPVSPRWAGCSGNFHEWSIPA
jgi:hypothetical protein